MIRRPPRSTLDRSSAASDVYKRQVVTGGAESELGELATPTGVALVTTLAGVATVLPPSRVPVSYTHLRAHETVLDLVCRLLLETKNNTKQMLTYT